MNKILWHEVTRNCHVGKLSLDPSNLHRRNNDDFKSCRLVVDPECSPYLSVVTVERHQKNRPDGSKHDWHITVLGDRYSWNETFCNYDPQDLESTKRAAEARVRWAIECLHKALKR